MTEQQNMSTAQKIREQRNLLRMAGFDFNKTYYISGPMSGYENYNYQTFEATTQTFRNLGLAIESPHENPQPEDVENMDETTLWNHMMQLCREQMKTCHGIIMLSGWPQSAGARQELRYALMKEWNIWYFDQNSSQLVSMNKMEESHEQQSERPEQQKDGEGIGQGDRTNSEDL